MYHYVNVSLAENPDEIPPPPSYDTIEWEDERVMAPMESYNYHVVKDLLNSTDSAEVRFKGLRILAKHIEVIHDESEREELFTTWNKGLENIVITGSENDIDQQLSKLVLIELTSMNEVRC